MFKLKKNSHAQSTLEFTFVMIMVFLIMFGVARIFLWTGKGYAKRIKSHETLLKQTITEDFGECEGDLAYCLEDTPCGCEDRVDEESYMDGPLAQLQPSFDRPLSMNAVWDGFRW